MGNLCAGLVFGGGDTFLGWKEESPGYLQRGQDLAETFAQLPVPGLKRSHTSWGGEGETQPSSQETASVLASFVLLTSWKTYWRKVGRKDASVKGQKQRGSRWWELGAANSTICLPHLLILHTILQLAPPLPGTTPSLFHLKAGREAL